MLPAQALKLKVPRPLPPSIMKFQLLRECSASLQKGGGLPASHLSYLLSHELCEVAIQIRIGPHGSSCCEGRNSPPVARGGLACLLAWSVEG